MGSYDGAQAALNPLNFPVCLHDKELKFVTVGFTPSFADWLPFPGPSSLSYETALLIQHLSHLGPTCPMPNHCGQERVCGYWLPSAHRSPLHLNCCRQAGQLPQLHFQYLYICAILALRRNLPCG